ncbi:XRE family transcriptional regulator [Luteimonas aestuarii]|uniref:XRE family transcriptional regulator n=1 Tax=Luteimonas aestuarii TaxID=453837 RepID=A0A4R5TKF1_9GAMM|nr:XRE family transcriptional regulator [Luteimonas aestuarii]
MSLGTRIRQVRSQSGMTIRQLAGRINVSHATLGHWETGKCLPSVVSLLRISRETSCDFTWLATGHVHSELSGLTENEINAISCGAGVYGGSAEAYGPTWALRGNMFHSI